MRYILTLNFDVEVETKDKDLKEIEAIVAKSYSDYCGENVVVIERTEKEVE